MSCAKNHDIERRRAVVNLPRAREKEREEDTVCSVVHIIFSRDVISKIHTRDTQVSYVTQRTTFSERYMKNPKKSQIIPKYILKHTLVFDNFGVHFVHFVGSSLFFPNLSTGAWLWGAGCVTRLAPWSSPLPRRTSAWHRTSTTAGTDKRKGSSKQVWFLPNKNKKRG